MLTEEAHHMFVGETGVGRIIQRTCEVMKENKVEDPSDVRALGVIDLPTIQKYLNFHYSVTPGSLRLGCFLERRELLHQRAERTLSRNEAGRRSRAGGCAVPSSEVVGGKNHHQKRAGVDSV